MKVILDPGSTHNQDKGYVRELLQLAASVKADAIKFQLFPDNKNGNLKLNPAWLDFILAEAKLPVYASVWNGAEDELIRRGVKQVKLSHSQRSKLPGFYDVHEKNFDLIHCTFSPLDYFDQQEKLVPYFTLVSNDVVEYPAMYECHFGTIFNRFQGFSDHSVGYENAVRAKEAGCKYLEKHITLDHKDISCPDSRFGLKPNELDEMMSRLRRVK